MPSTSARSNACQLNADADIRQLGRAGSARCGPPRHRRSARPRGAARGRLLATSRHAPELQRHEDGVGAAVRSSGARAAPTPPRASKLGRNAVAPARSDGRRARVDDALTALEPATASDARSSSTGDAARRSTTATSLTWRTLRRTFQRDGRAPLGRASRRVQVAHLARAWRAGGRARVPAVDAIELHSPASSTRHAATPALDRRARDEVSRDRRRRSPDRAGAVARTTGDRRPPSGWPHARACRADARPVRVASGRRRRSSSRALGRREKRRARAPS